MTVHAATQRIGAGFGLDTELMLANMPRDVVFQQMETSASGVHTSSLIRWLPFGPAPERCVHLPERYRERIEALYGKAHLAREVMQGHAHLGEHASELESRYDVRRQTLRVVATRAGRGLATQMREEIRDAEARGALVAHVDLPLSDPARPQAVEVLRTLGFSFAGLLPEYRDGGVLRMQWLAKSVATGATSVLSSDSARTIETFVLEDRRSNAV